jgi:hypothetical protein
LADRLRRSGDRLAGRLLAAARARLAERSRGRGHDVLETRDGLIIAGRDLARRRRGTRDRLADPMLLWPGEDG